MRGRFARWVNTDPVSDSPDLADEPALRWRDDLPPRRVEDRRESTPRWRRWLAVAAGALIAGPFAILGALFFNSTAGVAGVLLVVVVGPVVEESMKGFAAIFMAEFRPWLVPAAAALVGMTVVSGLVFAVVENFWYLEVLIDDPSARITTVRWIFGPLVHGVGALLVGIGAARMWRRSIASGRRADFNVVRPWIVGAAIWHGGYNALATVLELTGTLD